MSQSVSFGRSRWSDLPPSEPDVVFKAAGAFREDSRPVVSRIGQELGAAKVNLTIGEPKEAGASGQEIAWTPLAFTEALHEVAERAQSGDLSLGYGTPLGHPRFRGLIAERIFGRESALIREGRVATVQTEGAVNALHLALGLNVRAGYPGPVWTSSPGWGNYPGIIGSHGLNHRTFSYKHGAGGEADVSALLGAMSSSIREHHTLILQPDGHNPTGWRVPDSRWPEIAEAAKRSGCFVILDFAYHGLIRGFEQDRAAIDAFVAAGVPVAVAYSCSKNFGIGGLRLGALSVVCSSQAETNRVLSNIGNTGVRPVISHPSLLAAETACAVFSDERRCERWEGEVSRKRGQIAAARAQFLKRLQEAGVDMPSGGEGPFFVLPREDERFVHSLKQFGIYTVGGRVFVMANPATMDYAARGIVRAMEENPEPSRRSGDSFGGGVLPGLARPFNPRTDGLGC